MANVTSCITSCGDQTYFGVATPTVGWNTMNIPSTITYDNINGSITVSGTSVNLGGIGSTTVASGSILTVNGSGTTVWSSDIGLNSDVTDFCEMILSALGHDITYDDFCKMSKQERKSLLRDIKIKRLLD